MACTREFLYNAEDVEQIRYRYEFLKSESLSCKILLPFIRCMMQCTLPIDVTKKLTKISIFLALIPGQRYSASIQIAL